MKMVNIMMLSLFLYVLPIQAQMDPVKQQTVELMVGEKAFLLSETQTQTQLNPGWNVAGFQTGGKSMRYIWGSVSRQICDSARPTFIIDPLHATLSDFILIRLKKKKQYRKLEKPNPVDNCYLRVTPKDFIVETTKDERFRITPREDLKKGEYILLDASQRTVGDMGDYTGWCFTVQ